VLRALTLLAALALPLTAAAEEPIVRVGSNRVTVDGELAWRGRAITSEAVWSERGDAIAFTGRDLSGRARLVVVIVDEALEPTAFSWPVPRSAQPARAVTWLGDGRVGAGPSELAPRMVAEFTLE
jgi:hypothetical protein